MDVYLLHWLVRLTLCWTVVGGQEPRIRELLHTLAVKEGSDVILSCLVENLGGRTVIWRRVADPYPISVGQTRFLENRKYQVSHQDDLWNLTIRDVGRNDLGEYECLLTGGGHYSRILELSMPGRFPRLLATTREVLVALGSTAVLPCSVIQLGSHVVLWRNQHGAVLAVRKKIYSGDRRHRVLQSGDDWSLQVRNVARDDLGAYVCIISSDPVLTRSVHLVHDGPLPTPPRLVTDGFLEVVETTEFSSLSLTCRFTGFPEPRVTWQRRVQRGAKTVTEDLPQQGPTLTLDSVTSLDDGNYICIARNGQPPAARARISVTIKVLPVTKPTRPTAPRVYPQTPWVEQRRGHAAILECLVVGLPRPAISWQRHGEIILHPENLKHSVTSAVQDEHIAVSSLKIYALQTSDFGDYVCQAVNAHGAHKMTIHLAEKAR